MKAQAATSSQLAVFDIKLHIVFVTKYRRKTLTPELRDFLHDAFNHVLTKWRCDLLEYGAEEEHVHLLVSIHPALDISVLVNNLKTATARRARSQFSSHLAHFYWKPYFWHRAYYVSSVGGATLETVRKYVEQQGTKEKPRKSPH